jgi:hypothetical protein
MRVGLTPRAFIMDKPTPPNHPTPPEKNRLAISELTTSQDFCGSLANKAGNDEQSRKTSVIHILNYQAGDVLICRARASFLLPSAVKVNFPDGIKQSVWRNTKLPANATPEERAESIAAYKARLLKRPDLLARLPELKGKRLVCWCAPNACHGDVLAEMANALPETDPTIRAGSLADDPSSLVKLADVPEFAPAAKWRFSRFATYADKAPSETKLAEIIHTIRTSTHLAKQVAHLRSVRDIDPKFYAGAKKRLPAVSFGGVFKGGHKAKQLTDYSGLVVIDLDHLTADQLSDVRSKLMTDKRLVALFVSPSGAGLKCLFWTSRPAADHLAVWSDIVAELRQTTGVQADESGKDVCRLCFLSHDPDAGYWPDAEEWLVLGRSGALPSSDPASGVLALSDTPQVAQAEQVNAVKKKSTKPAPKLTLDEVRSMLAVITIKPHDRPTWLAVAHSVGNTLTETEAVQVLDEWSSDLFNTEAKRYADEQGGFARQLAGRDATCTSATLIHHAKANGWRPPIPAVEVYYDYQRKVFCAKNSDGNWLREGADNLSRWMVAKQIAKDRDQASMICGQAMDTRSVDWSAPLAGYPEGYRTMGDARLLITAGPKLITACAGECPTISGLLFGLFAGDAAADQMTSFCLWIKHRVQMLENVSWRSGHILCLVGPVGCGKSLVQRLITEMLGGRVASPVAYFAGDASGFNAELFKAEHLAIEDEGSSTDPKSRLRMGDHWKRVAVNQDHRCHGKHQEALTLRPLWSCSVSLNDEGERLLVIPPMTADIVGKVMILKCSSPIDPFPTATDAAKAEYWRRLVSELPAFLAYCQTLAVVVKDTETRDERDERSRFGFVAYRSPEIMAETEGHAPEKELLELIDLICFSGTLPAKVVQTLVEWEITLTTDQRYGKRAAKLLDWSGALMTYFKRLKGKAGGRVEHHRDRTKRYWQVSREVEENQ